MALLFELWFSNDFIPAVEQHQQDEQRHGKVILLVDNASSHVVSERLTNSGRFKIVFLPPNTASLIQPMDQGVISKCKRLYRRALATRLLSFSGSFEEFYKSIDVKEASLMIDAAWKVTAENVWRSFRKLLVHYNNNNIPETAAQDPDDPEPVGPSADVQDVAAVLRQRPELSALSDDDVWAWFSTTAAAEAVTDEQEDDEDDDEEAEEESSGAAITVDQIRAQMKKEHVSWAAEFERVIKNITQSQPTSRRSLFL